MRVLTCQTPDRFTRPPKTWPAWRDLAYTPPGIVVGLLAGVAVSLVYFLPRGTEWLPLFVLAGKFMGSSVLVHSDRWRWVGIGLAVSILIGVPMFFHAVFGNWCC